MLARRSCLRARPNVKGALFADDSFCRIRALRQYSPCSLGVHVRKIQRVTGKMRGVPARWGHPARGIPTLLDPVQAEEHHETGPASSRDPPFRPGPPSLLHLFGKRQGARGPGSRGGPGSWFSRDVGGLGVGIPRARSPQRAGTP